jgi:hypothetical protein
MTPPYMLAWSVMVLLTPLAVYGFLRATRGLPLLWPRRALALVLASWLLVPAPIPNFPGNYAPAFFVFVFEAVFQHGGKPRVAAIILGMATLAALVSMLLYVLTRRLMKPRAASS